MPRTRPSIPTRQMRLVPPTGDGHDLQVALTVPQQRELTRALAELLLRAAVDVDTAAPMGGRDAER